MLLICTHKLFPNGILTLLGNLFYLFYQVLQIALRAIIKNKICTYEPQIDLCKTVVSGTYDGSCIKQKTRFALATLELINYLLA